MPGKLPPSFPYKSCPSLPKGSVSFGARLAAAPERKGRTAPPEGQTPPTEANLLPQHKQQAGMV